MRASRYASPYQSAPPARYHHSDYDPSLPNDVSVEDDSYHNGGSYHPRSYADDRYRRSGRSPATTKGSSSSPARARYAPQAQQDYRDPVPFTAGGYHTSTPSPVRHSRHASPRGRRYLSPRQQPYAADRPAANGVVVQNNYSYENGDDRSGRYYAPPRDVDEDLDETYEDATAEERRWRREAPQERRASPRTRSARHSPRQPPQDRTPHSARRPYDDPRHSSPPRSHHHTPQQHSTPQRHNGADRSRDRERDRERPSPRRTYAGGPLERMTTQPPQGSRRSPSQGPDAQQQQQRAYRERSKPAAPAADSRALMVVPDPYEAAYRYEMEHGREGLVRSPRRAHEADGKPSSRAASAHHRRHDSPGHHREGAASGGRPSSSARRSRREAAADGDERPARTSSRHASSRRHSRDDSRHSRRSPDRHEKSDGRREKESRARTSPRRALRQPEPIASQRHESRPRSSRRADGAAAAEPDRKERRGRDSPSRGSPKHSANGSTYPRTSATSTLNSDLPHSSSGGAGAYPYVPPLVMTGGGGGSARGRSSSHIEVLGITSARGVQQPLAPQPQQRTPPPPIPPPNYEIDNRIEQAKEWIAEMRDQVAAELQQVAAEQQPERARHSSGSTRRRARPVTTEEEGIRGGEGIISKRRGAPAAATTDFLSASTATSYMDSVQSSSYVGTPCEQPRRLADERPPSSHANGTSGRPSAASSARDAGLKEKEKEKRRTASARRSHRHDADAQEPDTRAAPPPALLAASGERHYSEVFAPPASPPRRDRRPTQVPPAPPTQRAPSSKRRAPSAPASATSRHSSQHGTETAKRVATPAAAASVTSHRSRTSSHHPTPRAAEAAAAAAAGGGGSKRHTPAPSVASSRPSHRSDGKKSTKSLTSIPAVVVRAHTPEAASPDENSIEPLRLPGDRFFSFLDGSAFPTTEKLCSYNVAVAEGLSDDDLDAMREVVFHLDENLFAELLYGDDIQTELNLIESTLGHNPSDQLRHEMERLKTEAVQRFNQKVSVALEATREAGLAGAVRTAAAALPPSAAAC